MSEENFYDVVLPSVRITTEQHYYIKKLRLNYPELFKSDSDVVRASLNFFKNNKVFVKMDG